MYLLELTYVTSKLVAYVPLKRGSSNGYYPEGISVTREVKGRTIALQVVSQEHSKDGRTGAHLLAKGIQAVETSGERARRVGGLAHTEAYIAVKPREFRYMTWQMIFEVAVARSDAVASRVAHVLPLLGVDPRDVKVLQRQLFAALKGTGS